MKQNTTIYEGRVIKTMDCTPTWSALLPLLIDLSNGSNAEARSEGKKQLAHMAKVADMYVAHCKKEADKEEANKKPALAPAPAIDYLLTEKQIIYLNRMVDFVVDFSRSAMVLSSHFTDDNVSNIDCNDYVAGDCPFTQSFDEFALLLRTWSETIQAKVTDALNLSRVAHSKLGIDIQSSDTAIILSSIGKTFDYDDGNMLLNGHPINHWTAEQNEEAFKGILRSDIELIYRTFKIDFSDWDFIKEVN